MAWMMVLHSALLGHESFVSYGSWILRDGDGEKPHRVRLSCELWVRS
jgi:hypothetical protein